MDIKQLYFFKLAIVLLAMHTFLQKAYGQQLPPRPIAIYTNPTQGLYFGAFYHGMAGGSLIVYPDGSRTTTGDVIQASLGFTYSPAIFEIEADPGTRVGIVNWPTAVLTGSNGGSMTVQLGPSDLGNSFIVTTTPPDRMQIRIGGTLTVGNDLANPVGAYNGQFTIMFIQE
ncbi:MAG: hypothetical protein K0R82_501 [Flavipsychrobacter sp.]|jgi:hypothetical protein|nr:hypothetical protein [Flavipsychrobacter sp.]